ncbi:MAG: lysophospholipid acyltransferase family protein [Pseudomonadota bacterium]|jgi:KDO2-lipid IV(A) lauroyltransferase
MTTTTNLPLIDDPTCGVELEPYSRYLAPRWWPAWIAAGITRGMGALPYRAIRPIAFVLGRLAYLLAVRDRRTTRINLQLAYPALAAREIRARAIRHFESLVYSLWETGLVWYGAPARLRRHTRIEGAEHLDAAVAAGRGVLLLGAHFTTNEIAAAVLPQTGHACDVMYKRSRNALLQQLALHGRTGKGGRIVPSDKFVEMLKTLKRGGIFLYAPDQRFDGDGYVLVPLFGVPALSNPGTTFVVRATRCAVLPFFPERLADGSGYVIRIGAPLDNFPTGDGARDVARYHGLIEAAVERAPAQYLWSYKRFRPAKGEPDPYRKGALRGAP